jgi:hypothetical protein
MKKNYPARCLSVLLLLSAFFLLSCAATGATTTAAPAVPSVPTWAASPRSLDAVYPDSAYIAAIGRGQSREAAETAGAAEIARYFTSRISASVKIRETSVERDGVTSESLEFESAAFVTSEIELFGLRYAPDAFYNEAEKHWQTVAYIDRAEAWAVYEPRFRKQAAAFQALYEAAEAETDPFKKALRWAVAERYAGNAEFEAANTLGQMLHPARMNAAFSAVRDEIAALPQKTDEARRDAAVYIDCPLDFESIIVGAFSRAISAEGFPVSRTRADAAAVCAVTVDEGKQERELGACGTLEGSTRRRLFR